MLASDPIVELGARLQELVIDASTASVRATYVLIDPTGAPLGGGGTVQIDFAALDAIDRRLGGTAPLTDEQRIDLATKFIRPLIVASFDRVVRQDVTVHGVGEVADMRRALRGGGA